MTDPATDPLKDLLDQLDNNTTVTDISSEVTSVAVDSTADGVDHEMEMYSTNNISSNSLSETVDDETVDDEAAKEEVDEFEEFVLQNAVDLTNLVVHNCNEDRKKTTEVIDMIEGLIRGQDKVIHGGSIGRLIQAIDTRSGINATIVKVLESQAKILSARKGPSKNVVNNNNTTASGDALIAILESGMKNK